MIYYDEKSLEWAQVIVRAIAPTSVDHQEYEARGPKDAIKSETFGIWLPDNEGLEIKNVLNWWIDVTQRSISRTSDTNISRKVVAECYML